MFGDWHKKVPYFFLLKKRKINKKERKITSFYINSIFELKHEEIIKKNCIIRKIVN